MWVSWIRRVETELELAMKGTLGFIESEKSSEDLLFKRQTEDVVFDNEDGVMILPSWKRIGFSRVRLKTPIKIIIHLSS
ncbi:hypothetical protein Tco_0065398 [Tanacetum coccineum]